MDTKWTKQYGKVFGTYLFTLPEIIVSDVDLLKQLLVKDFHNFTNRRVKIFSRHIVRRVCYKFQLQDNGNFNEEDSIFAKLLTVLKDDEWKNVRNTITPAFTSGKMKSMTHLVDDCVRTLMEILSVHASTHEVFNVKE